jgi:hypothetical protein
MPKATAVPTGMERLSKVPNDLVVGKYLSVILVRYSESGINFKGTRRPYCTDKMNPN